MLVLIIIGLVVALVVMFGKLMTLAVRADKVRYEKDCSLLKYEQLQQKHEYCMESVLNHSRHMAFTVGFIFMNRRNGKRPKWTIADLQDFRDRTELLMKMAEDNAVESP